MKKSDLGQIITILANVGVIAGILFLGYATKTTHQYSRLALGTWFLATPLVLTPRS